MKQYYISLEEELAVDVKFKVNEYREIVVLSVDCENAKVRKFIAHSLNNKKPVINTYKTRKLYSVPVRLIP